MSDTKAVLERLRDQIDAERGMLSGIDGYNYTSGEEYGMRRAMRLIDSTLAHLPTEAAKHYATSRADGFGYRDCVCGMRVKDGDKCPPEAVKDVRDCSVLVDGLLKIGRCSKERETRTLVNEILSHFDAKPEASVERMRRKERLKLF